MFSGAVQNPDIKSLWPNILLWSKRADLSISMSYLLRVPGAEKKRKKKGICKTWMPIFFFGCYAVLAYAVVNTIDLAIIFWSYWKRKRERLHYIVEDHSLRQVPPSSLLSLSVLLWFAYSAGLPQSHHSGSSLSFVWACWICFALWGARWGWGVRAITCLSSIPPLSFLSFPSASVVLFFFCIAVYCFCLPKSFPHTSSSNISPSASSVCLQTLVLSVNRRRTVPYCPRWAH